MRRRIRKIANFFAFNLLFFALYLNFIHKDKVGVGGIPQTIQQPAAFSSTVPTANAEQVIEKKNEVAVSANLTAPEKAVESNTAALKLSIN